MTAGKFADLVMEMRDAQRKYFRTRSKASLEASKSLEQRVDKILEERKRREQERANPSLF